MRCDQVLPPSLHCEQPHALIEETPFRLLTHSEPWSVNGTPRRAAVNAFGFGGIDAHVVLESGPAPRPASTASDTTTTTASADAPRMAFYSAPDERTLLEALSGTAAPSTDGPCRLVLSDPTTKKLADLGIELSVAEPCFPIQPAHGHPSRSP